MKYLIVGLGNIGSEYADSRHNIGFMVADALAKKASVSFFNMRLAYYTEFNTKGRSVHVIKPTTFMNLSGKALNYWMQDLKIPLENVLVIVDDLAIPFESIKLKPKGSNAGHNGLKSIEAVLGGSNYARLRFGIGDDYPKGRQVDYVLSSFEGDEKLALPALIHKCVEMVESFITVGPELTMTRFNK